MIGRAPPWFFTSLLIIDFQNERYNSVLERIGPDIFDVLAAFQGFGLSAHMHMGNKGQVKSFLEKVEQKHPNYLEEIVKSSKLWHLNDKLKQNLVKGGKSAGFDMSGFQ